VFEWVVLGFSFASWVGDTTFFFFGPRLLQINC